MPTIPTGKMERELRRLYMRWVHQLPKHENDLHDYVAKFQRQSTELIEKMGGDIARLGVLADFPAPRRLDLSLHVGTIYSDMELAAISAQIGTGLNPTDTARALVRSGVDKSYRRLERLARTETVRAYWKNAWDSIDGLGLVMVWGAENGPRTCAWCKERDGLVMDSSELRDHPNGRCTPLPTHPSQVEYKGSVDASGRIYQDPAWDKKPVEESDRVYDHISEEEALALSKEFSELTYDEQLAVIHYQRSGYKGINQALRTESSVNVADLTYEMERHLADQQDYIKLIDAVMKPLDRDVTIMRGQGWNSMLRDLGIDSAAASPGKWDIEGKIGTQLRQPGYYSASISGSVAKGFLKDSGFLIDIEVPRGVGVHYLKTGTGHDDEKELLLQRGLDFVLTKAELVSDPRNAGESIWRITLRAVL